MPTEMLDAITLIEVIGWAASFFTVMTYAMNTMLPLRILALASSVSFLIYGFVLEVWPLLAMELVLIPINAFRLWQLLSLRRRLQNAGGTEDDNFSVIRRYGKALKIRAGTTIFQKGDAVDNLYFLDEGRVVIEELGLDVKADSIFGEIGFFTDAAERTATAICFDDAVVYTLNKRQFIRLQFEDPNFGLSVMRTVTRRLQENAARPAASQA